MLNDQGVLATQKLKLIQATQGNLREILWLDQSSRAPQAALENFEVFVDCLIFFVLKNANLKAQTVSKLEE